MKLFSFFNVFNQYTSDGKIVTELLRKLQIKVAHKTVDQALQRHPDYPSMLSISDCLKKWNINNAVIKVEAQNLQNLELPFPCIAYTKVSSFIIVDNVINDHVYYTDWRGKNYSKRIDEFLKIWDGILLLAECDEHSGEKDYRESIRKEFLSSLCLWSLLLSPILLCVFAISYSFLFIPINSDSFSFSVSILLKALGIVVSILLLWHEIDKNNPLLQQICSAGKKVNCDAILSSKASKIFSWLSWSEIGFFYFAGGFLALLFSGSWSSSVLLILACINFLALPYTVFSILYQWRVAKQWCMLCLCVQVLLVVEFFVSLLGGYLVATLFTLDFFLSLNASFLTPIIPAFLLPIIIWYAIKQQLHNAQQGKRDFMQLQRIKYNSEVFETLLQKQKQITIETEGLGITLGNPQAKIHLIKVCNPYCGPCARAHKIIDEWIENGQIRVQIIFTVTNEEKDYRALPTKHLLAIAAKKDKKTTQNALNNWYNAKEKNYEQFNEKYSVSKDELDKQSEKIEAMKKWCEDVNIRYTPSIFINGYLLPDSYQVEDLKYFLDL